MLSLPSSVRIFLCRTPTDLRYSFDGLMSLAERIFEQDPLSGHLFLFINRRRDRIKILFWDRDGLCIWYKRLEVGTFQFPSGTSDGQGVELDYSQLAMLLGGIDLRSARQRKRYRRAAEQDKREWCGVGRLADMSVRDSLIHRPLPRRAGCIPHAKGELSEMGRQLPPAPLGPSRAGRGLGRRSPGVL